MRLNTPSMQKLSEARSHLRAGRHAAALSHYQQLTTLHPAVARLWYEQALAAKSHTDFPLAAASCREGSRLAGSDGQLLVLLGQEFKALRRPAESRDCFQRALGDPATAGGAIRGLLDWHQRHGDTGRARELLDDYLATRPRDPVGRHLDALLCEQTGDAERAETLSRDLLKEASTPPETRMSAAYLLARILDQTQRPDDAMAALRLAKSPMLADPGVRQSLREYDEGVAARGHLLAQFSHGLIRRWQEAAPVAGANHPQVVFLGGHPRSGTTLLERVLEGHPEITAFDESPAFYLTVDPFLRTHGAAHPEISNLPTAYFRQLAWEHDAEITTTRVLDKNPSLTACLHSWLRVFPGVKVVIALRHPLDVILSSYFLEAPFNALSANFCSLARVGKHYRDLMDVWLRLRDLGGFQWLESRYEDLVAAVPEEGARVTRFAGLEWLPEQADFHQSRSQRPLAAPTYHEVTRPAHQRSVNRWPAYERHLEPLRAELRPYLARLGYDG